MEKLIDPQAGDQIRRHGRSTLLLYRSEPIIDKIGRRALHGLAGSPPEAVITKARGEAGVADPGQLISDVPRIRGRHSGLRHRREIRVQIAGLGIGPEGRPLIIGVVTDRRERGRINRLLAERVYEVSEMPGGIEDALSIRFNGALI